MHNNKDVINVVIDRIMQNPENIGKISMPLSVAAALLKKEDKNVLFTRELDLKAENAEKVLSKPGLVLNSGFNPVKSVQDHFADKVKEAQAAGQKPTARKP
jgi:hypothetical protein